MADWKDRLGVLYSTNPDYQYQTAESDDDSSPETLAPARQELRISLSRKQRAGKEVTIISGFVGREEDLTALAKQLKTKCGVGGSTKDGEILMQGDLRTKVRDLLRTMGYVRTK